jgi:hypothetical protein
LDFGQKAKNRRRLLFPTLPYSCAACALLCTITTTTTVSIDLKRNFFFFFFFYTWLDARRADSFDFNPVHN